MDNTTPLYSIKKDNTRLVLEAIARTSSTTKLEISEETGLSLMTVGKIVSILTTAGIVVHEKKISQKAGRRAEVYRVRHDWLIPMFEVSSRVFKFYITDLKGKVVDKMTYRTTSDPQYISNEFVSFMKRTLELLRESYKNKKALGIGVSVAGVYDKESDTIRSSMLSELSSIKLMSNITKLFRNKNVVIENANRLCAAGIIEGLESYKDRTISCLSVGDTIECTTCDHGVYLSGSGNLAGRLGDIPYSPGVTYANFIKDTYEPDFVQDSILDLLRIVSVAYDPDTIYLCSDKFSFTPPTIQRLESALKTSMIWPKKSPELKYVHSTELESLSAVISRVIENWLDETLKKST